MPSFTSQPALSTLTAPAPQTEFALSAPVPQTFTVTFTVDFKKFGGEKTILKIPGVLSVRLRQHNPLERTPQNYSAYKMPDGSVPVLEATVEVHSVEHPDWVNMTIGIPLALLKRPWGEHEITLDFSGVRWTLYADGELLDNDFPFGYPQWAQKNGWKLDAEFVKNAAIFLPGIAPQRNPEKTSSITSIQYWTPPGHNAWVGDVATFFYRGRYHVFYLYDRRHHKSKFGQGAHYFEHLSTTDFETWTAHEAAVPLDEPWECLGTGTPFISDGRLCLSYGLHTERVYPDSRTTEAAQWEYLKKHGCTGEFQRKTTSGIPVGATYSVSEDGVSRFKKTGTFFHPCRNPSVYTDPNGRLRMLANAGSKGIWEADSVNGGWRCVHPDFPLGGDCTFFFRWGRFDYIIGGFTRLWAKPAAAPDSAYEDVVSMGLDFYDGLSVPAITEIEDGRFLMAAWVFIGDWGGPLVIRELIQLPDGRIGSKWMKEITPKTENTRTLAASVSQVTTFPVGCKSFMLTFNVQPAEAGNGRFAVSFLPEHGVEAACELQVCLGDQRAQFGPGSLNGFAPSEKSLREGGRPELCGNYAIENLIGVDEPFTVRVMVKGDDKFEGSLVDAEIAGQRTMIAYRNGLAVKNLRIHTEGIELNDVKIAPLHA